MTTVRAIGTGMEMGIEQLTATEGSGGPLHLLESLDRVNRCIQSASALEPMMAAVLDEVLQQFACDRAWLLESRSEDGFEWAVRMLRARPEYPGPTGGLLQVPPDPVARASVRHWLDEPRLFHFGPGGDAPVPPALEAAFQVRSVLGLALHPRAAAPFLFGLHQCSHARVWSPTERGLFHEVGNRLADGLSGLLLVERLRAADARHELAQRVARFGFWDLDTRSGRVTLSAECARLLGLPGARLEMSTEEWRALLAERVHPEDHARLRAQLEGIPVPEPGPESEFLFTLPGGTSRTLRFRGESTRGPDGGMDRVFGTAEDVSDLRAAELRLRESESRYRAFVQHAADAYFVHEQGGVIVEVNDEACRSLGYSRHELIGQTPLLFDAILDREQYLALDRRLTEEGSVTFDTVHRRKSGETFPVEVRIRSIVENGRAHRVSFVRDLSAQRRAQHDLRESHARLHAIIEGTPDAVFLKDLDGRYVLINTAGAAFVGRPVADILGRTDGELMAAEEAEVVMEHDRRVMDTGVPLLGEEHFTSHGTERTYHAAKTVFRDSNGEVAGLIGISRDISTQRQLEAQLVHAHRLEAIGRLAGGVAHDFNNLLTVINGYSALLLQAIPASSPEHDMLENIHGCGLRAAELTRQLLTFSRKQVLQPQVIEVGERVVRLGDMLRRLIGEDIELLLRAPSGPAHARVDPALLEQAIVNLVINARDAMPEGGQVVIETAPAPWSVVPPAAASGLPERDYVMVRVADTGTGMTDATRARIFEPFFTTKAPGRGTGLGLAMVYGFVQQSGGAIAVDSTLGEGTEFRIWLPASAPEPQSIAPSPGCESFAARGHETILLVDDEPAVRVLLRTALSDAGHHVLEAADGESALRLAGEHPGAIHAVVSDLMLPRMSGESLLRQLQEQRPDLLLIAISGHAGGEHSGGDRRMAGVTLLQKPFLPAVLVRKLRERFDAVEVHDGK